GLAAMCALEGSGVFYDGDPWRSDAPEGAASPDGRHFLTVQCRERHRRIRRAVVLAAATGEVEAELRPPGLREALWSARGNELLLVVQEDSPWRRLLRLPTGRLSLLRLSPQGRLLGRTELEPGALSAAA